MTGHSTFGILPHCWSASKLHEESNLLLFELDSFRLLDEIFSSLLLHLSLLVSLEPCLLLSHVLIDSSDVILELFLSDLLVSHMLGL